MYERMSDSSTEWMNRAACLEVDDPELFFPVGETGPARIQIERAKEVCGTCAVRENCLNWAMFNNISDGIWGGLSESERRSLKRRASRRCSGL